MEVNKDTIWFYIIDKVIIVMILGFFAYRNNRKLETFKNELLKEKKIFEERYLGISKLIGEFRTCYSELCLFKKNIIKLNTEEYNMSLDTYQKCFYDYIKQFRINTKDVFKTYQCTKFFLSEKLVDLGHEIVSDFWDKESFLANFFEEGQHIKWLSSDTVNLQGKLNQFNDKIIEFEIEAMKELNKKEKSISKAKELKH